MQHNGKRFGDYYFHESLTHRNAQGVVVHSLALLNAPFPKGLAHVVADYRDKARTRFLFTDEVPNSVVVAFADFCDRIVSKEVDRLDAVWEGQRA
jgi:hypothetical protein